MPRTKGATDKQKRKSKLIRNTALTTGGAALVTGTGLYGKNVAGRVKVAKGLEKLEVDDLIKQSIKNPQLLSKSTEKAQEIAQRTNLSRARKIIKGDILKGGSKVIGKIVRTIF